jgi:hypothetical protein
MVFALSVRDAAAEAARKTNIELWTLYGIGVAFTILRTYSRVRAVGLRHLRLDDYLMWIGIVCSDEN